MDYNNYPDYPLNTSTPPSMTSESPPPMRRAALDQPHGGELNNHHHLPNHIAVHPSGYDELDITFQQQVHFQQQQNQLHQQNQHNPYGYAPGPQGQLVLPNHPGAEVVFNPYEQAPLADYLDCRPSYDDHATYSNSIPPPPQPPHANNFDAESHESAYHGMYGTVPPPPSVNHHQPFPMQDQLIAPDGSLGDVRWRDPDLHEVVEFLVHPNSLVRANAAAYLQVGVFCDCVFVFFVHKSRLVRLLCAFFRFLNHLTSLISLMSCAALMHVARCQRR